MNIIPYSILISLSSFADPIYIKMVNIPKERKTFCKGKKCKKHTLHKVTQYKAGKRAAFAQVKTHQLAALTPIDQSTRSTSRSSLLDYPVYLPPLLLLLKFLSITKLRYQSCCRVREGITRSKRVMVVRPSPSSIRRPRQQRRSSYV